MYYFTKETDELLAHNPMQLTNIGDINVSSQHSGGSLKKSILLSNGTTQITAAAISANNAVGGCDTTGNHLSHSNIRNDRIICSSSSVAKDQLLHHQQLILQVSDNTLNALFEEYKDTKEDAILSEGIERLCNDLGYKPDDFAILVLAWRLDASQMCRFTKSEFIQGLQAIRADTIDEIRRRLEQIVDKLKTDLDMFKQLYRFTFRFGLEPGHRIVSLEMAILLWQLVFTVHTPPILDRWLFFLGQHPNIRGVPKDTWNMFLNFSETFDIASYDDTEAWPSLFDDFVEYETDRANQNDVKKDAVGPVSTINANGDSIETL